MVVEWSQSWVMLLGVEAGILECVDSPTPGVGNANGHPSMKEMATAPRERS